MAEEKEAKKTQVKTLAEEAADFEAELFEAAEAAKPGASKARLEQAAFAVRSAVEALVQRSGEAAEAKRQAESIAADAAAAA